MVGQLVADGSWVSWTGSVPDVTGAGAPGGAPAIVTASITALEVRGSNQGWLERTSGTSEDGVGTLEAIEVPDDATTTVELEVQGANLAGLQYRGSRWALIQLVGGVATLLDSWGSEEFLGFAGAILLSASAGRLLWQVQGPAGSDYTWTGRYRLGQST